MQVVGEGFVGTGNWDCKGPEMGSEWMCLRLAKGAGVDGAGGVTGHEVTEGAANRTSR